VGQVEASTQQRTCRGSRSLFPGVTPAEGNLRSKMEHQSGSVRHDTMLAMALIDKPERARQLARAIASDLTLYHEKKIVDGIDNGTLFDGMAEEIEEGRALFKSRVTPEIYDLNIYDRAIVDVMIKSKGHVKSKIW